MGGLHICEQNCALIVQSDLNYWGLDDIHLQVENLQKGFCLSVQHKCQLKTLCCSRAA